MRTEQEILKDFQRIDSALSPENLYCDNEISIETAEYRYKELMAIKARLIKELGREPSFNEIWHGRS